jgi:hypothetical protein
MPQCASVVRSVLTLLLCMAWMKLVAALHNITPHHITARLGHCLVRRSRTLQSSLCATCPAHT